MEYQYYFKKTSKKAKKEDDKETVTVEEPKAEEPKKEVIEEDTLKDTITDSNLEELEKKHPKFAQGQMLHAKSLGFVHPKTGKYMFFESDIPSDFEDALDLLRKQQ